MSADNIQLNINVLAPVMPEDHKVKAIDLFSIPSSSYNETSMSIFIVDRLREIQKESVLSYEIDTYGNILITKGDAEAFPCFCAHLDTVHTYENGFNVMEETVDGREYLYAQDDSKLRVGIGGDDKCGIFVCLHLLNALDYVKIIFFSQEESGGIGSSNIDVSFFKDCMFLGGIDRWNGKDFVNSYGGRNTISKRFNRDTAPLLDKYGYFHSSGMFTDSFNVQERGINISCFNMSCGYYAHHSNKEYVDLNELWNACLLAEELSSLEGRKYSFQLPPSSISFARGLVDPGWNDWDRYSTYKSGTWKDSKYSKRVRCEVCDRKLTEHEMKTYGCYCYDCWIDPSGRSSSYDDYGIQDNISLDDDAIQWCIGCEIELLPGEKGKYGGYCVDCWEKLRQRPLNDSIVHCYRCNKELSEGEQERNYGYCSDCWNDIINGKGPIGTSTINPKVD